MVELLARTAGGKKLSVSPSVHEDMWTLFRISVGTTNAVKVTMAPWSGIIFAADIIHAGSANTSNEFMFRGFCRFEGESGTFPQFDANENIYHVSRYAQRQVNMCLCSLLGRDLI